MFYKHLFIIKVIIVLCLSMVSKLVAQEMTGKISFTHTDSDNETRQEVFKAKDSMGLAQLTQSKIKKWQSEGYITTTLDSVRCANDSCVFYVYKGEVWKSGILKIDKSQRSVIEAAGMLRVYNPGKILDSREVTLLKSGLAKHFADHGYPFAKVGMDSVIFEEGKMSGTLVTNPGPFIIFDSFNLTGFNIVSGHFLTQYLQIKRGQPYSHSKVEQINTKLNALNFMKAATPPTVFFINNQAKVNLNLVSRPANRFDFILGVLRQPNSSAGSNFVITGDILAELNNRFGMGEYVFGQFKRLRPENQEVILKSEFPYLPGLPVGSHLDFRIFKFGTENIDVILNAGGQYIYGEFNQLKFGWVLRSSRLIEVNRNQIIQNRRLPARLDVVYSGVGIHIINRQLDNRLNPSRGLFVQTAINGGRRRIIPNVTITSIVGFEQSYDTLRLNSGLLDVNAAIEYYVPLGDRFTVKSAFNGGIRYNENGIFENEKFRLGGNRLLRGFDEESIFTDRYGYITAELRLLFDRNSYLTLPFIDFGYTRVQSNGENISDRVLGTGMGLTFGTTAGIFNISFAAGSRLSNPLDFGQMKIHFGYVSLF